MFDGIFRHLILTVAQSKLAVIVAVHYLHVVTEGVFGTFCVDDRVRLGKPVLVALRPAVIPLIDFVDIEDMVDVHSYSLTAVILAWKATKTVDRAAVLPLSAAWWFPCYFTQGEVSLFFTAENTRLTVCVVHYYVKLKVIASIPWRRSPPSWAFACAQNSAFLSECFLTGITSPPHFPIASQTTSILFISSAPLPPPIIAPSSLSIASARPALLIISAMPTIVPTVTLVAFVAVIYRYVLHPQFWKVFQLVYCLQWLLEFLLSCDFRRSYSL